MILKFPKAPSKSLEGRSIKAVSEPEPPITQELKADLNTESDNPSTAEGLLYDDPVMLTDLVTLGEPKFDIHKCIHSWYNENKSFCDILKQPKKYKNFKVAVLYTYKTKAVKHYAFQTS